MMIGPASPRIQADLWSDLSKSFCVIGMLCASIALVFSIFAMTPAFFFIALGFFFAMRAVRARRRADSLYARAAAAALAEGGDPIAMPEAA